MSTITCSLELMSKGTAKTGLHVLKAGLLLVEGVLLRVRVSRAPRFIHMSLSLSSSLHMALWDVVRILGPTLFVLSTITKEESIAVVAPRLFRHQLSAVPAFVQLALPG